MYSSRSTIREQHKMGATYSRKEKKNKYNIFVGKSERTKECMSNDRGQEYNIKRNLSLHKLGIRESIFWLHTTYNNNNCNNLLASNN
jgi:hypothetical protein